MKTSNLLVSIWYNIKVVKTETFLKILITISLISSLRILLLPLQGDEITYVKIASNMILHGSYSLNGYPSTITPTMPFIIGLFFTKSNPLIGIIISRLCNLGLLLIGFNYSYRFLKNLKIEPLIALAIITLSYVNNNLILFSLLLYPESLIFCFFWIYTYYITKNRNSKKDLIIICSSLLILILARYLFVVLVPFAAIAIYKFIKIKFKENELKELINLIIALVIISLPFLFWIKFIYSLETYTNTGGLSYFARFRTSNLFELLQAGLGFGKLSNVDNYNGLPALISLFIPKIGLRNAIFSIAILLVANVGLFTKFRNWKYQTIISIMLLIMAGLIFAGTGFSRYWLPLLPIFILGFYHFMTKIRLKNSHFLFASKIIALVYVINEIRLDLLIIKNL